MMLDELESIFQVILGAFEWQVAFEQDLASAHSPDTLTAFESDHIGLIFHDFDATFEYTCWFYFIYLFIHSFIKLFIFVIEM